MRSLAQVILKSGKDASLYRFHPWVFSGAIKKITAPVEEGDLVEVVNNKFEFLGLGHYQIGSIAVRVFSFENRSIDLDFWKEKIESAYQYRLKIGLIKEGKTNIYRLMHAEGDGIPGLIIDVYNDTAIMQFHSIGMYLIKNELAQAIVDTIDGITAVYDKSEATMPKKGSIVAKDGFVIGESQAQFALENGLKFYIDWFSGQKTGFFIDQRENRALLGQYSKGRRVLNMFGYTGGFSVYAMQNGASLVHSVDASAKAIDLTNQNIKENFPEANNHEAFAEDAFAFMSNIKDKYDLIILDPPAFAKHQNVLHNALQGYKRLNQVALEQIEKGGILFTFSCSQVVTKENFRKSVFAAAANAKRKVRIMHQLSQPVDHPINMYHPEGEYLKGLVLYVE
ncbi:MAG: class I SAM-dependent rRNA methyltransferase [Bacteroidales bacterium]|nr:class I SAM-dependent rRNA methyltransferase [Bacteroidales bacterium]